MTEWQQRLRASGHGWTPQRELVLEAVERLGHATPDEVFAEVRSRSEAINLSTKSTAPWSCSTSSA